mmetsp:Transcript_168213/g.540424  ORF Transcript_168213/g.540424 Transcript_168213/m.540424 type:complete len:211 (+) Transcript_168213:1194-1826(+)
MRRLHCTLELQELLLQGLTSSLTAAGALGKAADLLDEIAKLVMCLGRLPIARPLRSCAERALLLKPLQPSHQILYRIQGRLQLGRLAVGGADGPLPNGACQIVHSGIQLLKFMLLGLELLAQLPYAGSLGRTHRGRRDLAMHLAESLLQLVDCLVAALKRLRDPGAKPTHLCIDLTAALRSGLREVRTHGLRYRGPMRGLEAVCERCEPL